MPRWLLWSPLAALTVATALFGLRAGWHHMERSETDVIERAAQTYMAGGQGRKPSDCSAIPSARADVWLVVTCVSASGETEAYQATRFGSLEPRREARVYPET